MRLIETSSQVWLFPNHLHAFSFADQRILHLWYSFNSIPFHLFSLPSSKVRSLISGIRFLKYFSFFSSNSSYTVIYISVLKLLLSWKFYSSQKPTLHFCYFQNIVSKLFHWLFRVLYHLVPSNVPNFYAAVLVMSLKQDFIIPALYLLLFVPLHTSLLLTRISYL